MPISHRILGMRDVLPFLKMGLRHFRNTRSIVPSSPWAVRKVCNRIASDVRQVVVEYGPGTGPYSRGMLKKGVLTDDSKLILIEIEQDGVDYLRDTVGNDERVRIFHGKAQDVRQILEEAGEKAADAVLSGIPYSDFDVLARDQLVRETADIMSDDGKHLVYQFKKDVRSSLERNFQLVRPGRIWLNIPPLHFFEATHPKRIGIRRDQAVKSGIISPRTSASRSS